MKQRWMDLLFLHWSVPPESLAHHIPKELEIDTFEGRAYVGLVPFTMTGVRPPWFPRIPLITDFHETNVRTYVRLRGEASGSNPAVWFFSLDAASALAVCIARRMWRLPYHYSRMSLRRSGDWIDYSSERRWPAPIPAHVSVQYRPVGPVAFAEQSTLEHFLMERYVLYSLGNERLYRGRVRHAPYPLQRAEFKELNENLLESAGFARPDSPCIAHYAAELDVDVLSLERVR